MPDHIFVVLLASCGLLALYCLLSLLKLRNDMNIALQGFDRKSLENAIEETIKLRDRDLEKRLKHVEAEWEDTFDKFMRVDRRRSGDMGGRTKRQKTPDEITPEQAGVVGNTNAAAMTKSAKRAEIMRRVRGGR